MPRPSLRRAARNPKPGAAGCGCPRPKTLRFASPPGASPFGDGTYSGNIVQGGVVLQPQPYLLNGELLPDCIVVTGAATVAPDLYTGASAFMCRNLVVNGGVLTASTNSKGLVGFVSGKVQLVNNGRIHIDMLGKAGNFGNLTAYDLAPSMLKGKLPAAKLARYTVLGEGADGGAAWSSTGWMLQGNTGTAAGAMQTGGGGSGSLASSGGLATVGAGGKGGPCCGGSASGGAAAWYAAYPATSLAAEGYGGAASAAVTSTTNIGIGGAAGNPVGGVILAGVAASGPGGGLLMLFTPSLIVNAGCVISADGAPGGSCANSYSIGGSGAGGGCLVIVTKANGLTNSGTIRANGGQGGASTGGSGHVIGSAGGVGSVNTFTI